MKKQFHSNQIFYIKGIGYARINTDNLINTQLPILATKIDSIQNEAQQQSVLFDPDMFKIDADAVYLNQGEQIVGQILSLRKLSIESQRRASSEQKIHSESIIIPLKIQQTNALVYCPESLLMKKITLNMRSLVQNIRKSIKINVEIVKTINNLKSMIFKQLNQQIGYYSDIRLIATQPILTELNMGSKTIWQCGLKDKSNILLMAKFNFTFKNIQSTKSQFFTLTNANTTLNNSQPITSTIKKQQPVKPSTIPPAVTASLVVQIENKLVCSPVKIKQQIAIQTNFQNKQQANNKQRQIRNPLSQRIYLQCNVKLHSGVHYWELKIDRLTIHQHFTNKLLIGISLKCEQNSQNSFINQNIKPQQNNLITDTLNNNNIDNTFDNDFIKIWGYDSLRCKKIELSFQFNERINNSSSEQIHPIHQLQKVQTQNSTIKQPIHNINLEDNNAIDEEDEEDYGSICKVNDTIGVFLSIKEKIASLSFYKNSVCLNQCYEIDIEKVKELDSKIDKSRKQNNKWYFSPFVIATGDLQITLDSKAILPLDSYRFK